MSVNTPSGSLMGGPRHKGAVLFVEAVVGEFRCLGLFFPAKGRLSRAWLLVGPVSSLLSSLGFCVTCGMCAGYGSWDKLTP